MRTLCTSIVVLAACAADTSITTSELTADDTWQQLGNGAAHTGFNPNETILDVASVRGLELAWASTTGLLPGGPSVATRRAYVGSENNTLYAFDAESGHRLWRAFAGSDVFSTPAAAYGRVYFVSDDGTLFVVASGTGALEWTADVRPYPSFASIDTHLISPVLHDGRVYVVVGTRLSVFAAEGCGAASCESLWYAEVPHPGGLSQQATPAIGKGRVFIFGGNGGPELELDLYAYSLDGCTSSPCAPSWVRPLPPFFEDGYMIAAGLVYHGGRVYAATNVGLYSVYADSGVLRWRRNFGALGSPAVTSGVVYQATSEGLIALEERNVGATIWRSPPAFGPAWPAAVANGVVYAGLGDSGRLMAFAVGCGIDGATCAPLWMDVIGGTRKQPVVTGGMVFVANEQTNELRALAP